MNEVYRLFDRRCRMETALEKLAKLRRRVRRFKKIGQTLKKLFVPNLEKALTFLNDSLLPSTFNAVERGYRRHRKMQKTVYGVRSQARIIERVALDMERDARTEGREQTTSTLCLARTRSPHESRVPCRSVPHRPKHGEHRQGRPAPFQPSCPSAVSSFT